MGDWNVDDAGVAARSAIRDAEEHYEKHGNKPPYLWHLFWTDRDKYWRVAPAIAKARREKSYGQP